MSDEFELRPELALGPNPFIEALPPFLSAKDMAKQFGWQPLMAKPWKQLPPGRREPLLEFASHHIAPTRVALPIAMAIQQMIRRSLVQRNPLNIQEQRRCNMIGVAMSFDKVMSTPRLDAAGCTLEGMTGMGKTTITSRALQLVAPKQVIRHDSSQSCGWERLTQVVWLYVDHPSNGTRGALLKRILVALDEALGSDFSGQYMRVTNIDALLTQVCKLLSLHRVALLIIDEKQERNFQDSPWNLEFVLFYLSLMNLGISVLLVGNPLAFEHLRSFSQVVRRFSAGGLHRLDPALTKNEAWWSEDFVPRMHRFNLVEDVLTDPLERAEFEFKHTAGIPGLLQKLHVESQRSALRRASGSTAVLEMADLHAALESPSYNAASKIAEQVLSTDLAEREMTDIPARADSDNAVATSEFTIPGPMTVNTIKRMVTNYQVARSRELTQFKRRLDAITGLSEDELQLLGVTTDLLTEVKAAQAVLEDGKAKAGKKRTSKSKPPEAHSP